MLMILLVLGFMFIYYLIYLFILWRLHTMYFNHVHLLLFPQNSFRAASTTSPLFLAV